MAEGGGVNVDADQSQLPGGLEHGASVSTGTEGAIHTDHSGSGLDKGE